MKKTYKRIKQIPLVISLFVLAGTAAAQSLSIQNYPQFINKKLDIKDTIELDIPIVIVEHTEVTVFNKTYYLDVLAPGIIGAEQTLQITGDGILAAFRNTSGNIRPYVLGTIIYFGNHEFEVLPTDNEYRVNAEIYSLVKNLSYNFVDGVLISAR